MIGTSIGDLFEKSVSQYSHKTAIKDYRRSVTYNELRVEVNKCAHLLMQLGIKHGDRVALYMKNCIEYIVLEFAIAKVGAVRVPLNHFLNEKEVEYRLTDSQSKAIFCSAEFYNRIQSIKNRDLKDLIVVTVDNEDDFSLNSLMKKSSSDVQEPHVKEEDIAAIMYTGGTTGRSKGVIHTHKSLISLMYSEIIECDITREGVLLHSTPLPHAAGFFILPGLLRGCTHILHKEFNPAKFCETVERERVTFALLVPTMIYAILDLEERSSYDLSSLQTIVYGAAPMAPARIEQALETFGPILIQIYSQMEVANQTTVLTKQDHVKFLKNDKKRLASCGKEVIISQVKIVDDNGQEVGVEEVGEIITRGPHMMKGYWKLRKETMETIKKGWIYTGDLAYRDQEGYIYLVDRKKDMIISGGFNIYTTNVESALFKHPGVKQAAVIGVPDDKWGEAVKAIVVKHDKSNVTEVELLSHCKKHLSGYEVPKSIDFVDTLPLTPYGKIDKKALRKRYWEKKERQIN
ncbi:acyl-CoA synthetase (AMP-forming)/AMP-acid ligase II [Caldalkalibacillus uzonensis]|uniref:Acyl-CoA synthetase (AMP-forming)/AMP-acid ligase II n=1 Tax=Caldalkalibacillus uzonensis TaxID=353224 RepID=A0ABU0CVU6_9BACI|nr:long-chain fatty acid--CoA ligase [Caldalkalibacillus uzonensis]MDQ0340539.1 acyl-CoA synthetase (AMP-forming)/AMP-acid ligase II [Caldalkalibacillus uzonensis]